MQVTNNPAPWSRTPPANPANILRHLGAKIDGGKCKEIRDIIAEDKGLEADFDRLCSDRALKESREQEYELHSDLSINADTAVQKFRQLRQFAEEAPVIRQRIEAQRSASEKALPYSRRAFRSLA